MTCDSARPCSRCVKRNIGHLCHDEHRDAPDLPHPAHPGTPSAVQAVARQATTSPGSVYPSASPSTVVGGARIDYSGGLPDVANRASVVSPLGPGGGPFMPGYMTQEPEALQAQNAFSDLNMLYDTTLLGFGNTPYSHFASEHANNEFLVLSDFLNIMGSPSGTRPSSPTAPGSSGNVMTFNGAAPYKPTTDSRMPDLTQEQKQVLARESARYVRNNSVGPRSTPASAAPSRRGSMAKQQQQQPQSSATISNTTGPAPANTTGNTKPSIGTGTSSAAPDTTSTVVAAGDGKNGDTPQEKFFLAAADPNPESPEDRLKQVINAKVEAGLMKPFDYVRGYARLQKYMEKNLTSASRSRILAPLSQFRPAFRAIAKRLTDVDLILVEEAFERLLLDYDRVFTSMSVPSCLWRRTGEIFRGNKEFAALIGVDVDLLRDGKLAVTELMAEESAVNYWVKYGDIAFDGQQKAVLTSCLLIYQGGGGGGGGASAGSTQVNGAASGGRPKSANSTGVNTPAIPMAASSSGSVIGTAPPSTAASATTTSNANANTATTTTAPTATALASTGSATTVKKTVVPCCFSFTIKRDRYNIPSCIVGNFIPMPVGHTAAAAAATAATAGAGGSAGGASGGQKSR